jgi:hypothetical protein
MLHKIGIAIVTLLIAGCATLTATANSVLTEIQAICGAVVNDSNGGIEALISTFPIGATAVQIATTACTYIDALAPIPSVGHRLKLAQRSVVINGVTINFSK